MLNDVAKSFVMERAEKHNQYSSEIERDLVLIRKGIYRKIWKKNFEKKKKNPTSSKQKIGVTGNANQPQGLIESSGTDGRI